jgi:bacterioferritin (cytochrome b1)
MPTDEPTDAEIETAAATADAIIDTILTEDGHPDLTIYSLWAQLVGVLLQLGWTHEGLITDLADLVEAENNPTEG